jgi:hypothetical protein
MWTYFICDTVSGEKLEQVTPLGDGGFSRRLNEITDGAHTFATSAFGAGATVHERRGARLDLTRPWYRTLVQCWDGVPRYAGVIVRRSLNGPTGSFSLDHKDLRQIFTRRTTLGTDGYSGKTDGAFPVTNETLASLVGQLLWVSMQGATAQWKLPLVLPPRGVPGTESRVWRDYQMPIVEPELRELQNVDGGPDIDFAPRWSSSGKLEWEVRVGDLTGPQLEWNLSAPEPSLTLESFVEDGLNQGTAFYAVGNGSETDLLVRTARTSTNGPALERVVPYAQVDDGDVLQKHASADARAFAAPTREYEFSMQAGGSPGLNDLVLGQTIRTYTTGDEWLLAGWTSHRLVGFTGDHTSTVKLQVQS